MKVINTLGNVFLVLYNLFLVATFLYVLKLIYVVNKEYSNKLEKRNEAKK